MSSGEFFQNKLILDPHPTTGIINIKIEKPIEQAEAYTAVTDRKLPVHLSEIGKTIDISNLSAGFTVGE